jgi:TonB-linked SusC/RagA family outer membrane protein
MKLTFFILILFASVLFATESHSQIVKVTITAKSSSFSEILSEIERQTDYLFVYDKSDIDIHRKISLEAADETVAEVLTSILRNTDIVYAMEGTNIMLMRKGNTVSIPFPIQQQNKKRITGTVTDTNGEVVIGANVIEKGTTNGIITDIDGRFSLSVTENAILQISYIGYVSQHIPVKTQTDITVSLKEDSQALDEIIVIGYGTAHRKEFTGSVSSIRLEDSPISQLPNMNALESLKGNVSGLNIGGTNSAGGQPSMQIRGQNSISGSNDPLIILDGVIFMGSLSDINPNEIASFDILKDAVSAAAYGSRSANGVIAINTKKGKIGKPMINVNSSIGFQSWQNRPVMMKGEEWLKTINERNKFTEGTTSWLKSGELKNLANGKETVWLDEATRTGIIQNYQMSISGAGEGINYYISVSYDDNQGIIKGDDFNRISLLGKIDTKITSWLKVGVDASFSQRDYSGFAANIGEAKIMSPYGVMYRDDQRNLERYPYTQSAVNPLWGVEDNTRKNKDIRQNFRLNSHVVVNAPWIEGLSYRLNILPNLDQTRSGNFYYEDYFITEGEGIERYEPSVVAGFLSKTYGNLANSRTYSYVVDNILTYKNRFDKHSVEATLVATRDYSKYKYINASGSDFQDNGNTTLGMWGLHKATTQKIELNTHKRTNIGYLARGGYSFDDRYYITGSFRRDGGSVFGTDNKWGNFAAVGTAWKITNEKFLENNKYLDDLKLKVSWGQNGNQGIDPYTTLSQVASGAASGVRYEFANEEGEINYGLIQQTMGDSKLGWESTEVWNVGFESSWLGNRLFADFDFYKSKTTDQIFIRNIPVMTGFNTVTSSIGQVNNLGIEATVRFVNIQRKDLNWTTTLTFWKNKNKLIHLYGEDLDGDGKEDDDISNSLFINKSLGAIYGYEQDGIVQEDDTEYMELTGSVPGNPKYKDIDGIPGITETDRKILGYSKENFRLNMENMLSYKNFEL